MTTSEFNNEFEISYNSIAGKSAPGLDYYEKSYYLTKAQEEIVKNYYDPDANIKHVGFDGSEKRRRDLANLIKSYSTNVSEYNKETSIHKDARFFKIPSDVMFIINEQATILSQGCYNETITNVKPVTYDEFNIQIRNPYKKPDHKTTWRLDYSDSNQVKQVELISPYNIGGLRYSFRYLMYPKPIILKNLNDEYPGENLSIDGETLEMTCLLSESICREIINRAVELAMVDYNQQNLQAKMQVDSRNE